MKENLLNNKNDNSLYFLESVRKVNHAILEAKDTEQMMRDVLDLVLDILKCDRSYLLYPCDPNTNFWTVPMARCKPEWPGLEPVEKVPASEEDKKIFDTLLKSKEPVIFGEKYEHKIPDILMERFKIKSVVAMAIYPKIGAVWQFGIHQCASERNWTQEDINIFKEIGYLITGALNNFLLLNNLQETKKELTEKVDLLEKANKVMVGRELKMVELKKLIEKDEKTNNL